ncbi:SCO5389 family protein [Micromonospora sp. WMMA1363]|uniref:SCO5389 family protein n=1 Tax=Micromonospora sp. WMMA1363 TaxID=3053985 RepID=UPI00259C926A|nr:SCO5389 family protein [Micromonospora sp. WMMA1363]MDM4721200.1 SCO5389 family protein [Micromonospora sp. WMMA1363]MDM4721508.1 SCO5389 family protein [Micromonospora sp. WMMA1363]
MSLTVPPVLLRAAESGPVDDEAFVACVRESLPYAWQTVSRVVVDLESSDAEFADNVIPPPSESERGQLLRALASDAIRSSLERHFGVKLAFQNCHRIAAFRRSAVDSDTYRRFVSTRGQLLNQSPELRDC